MAAIFALAASLLWGTSDFTGGVASRRSSSLSVLMVTMPVGLAGLLVGALVLGGNPTSGALGWGTLSGLAAGAGVLAFYKAMSSGSMSVVAPISAMAAAAVPVAVGVAIGERPGITSLVGVGLCLVATTMVSVGSSGAEPRESGTPLGQRGALLAVIAGATFGLYFVLLKPVGPGAGLWPLVTSRLASWMVIAAIGLAMGAVGRAGTTTGLGRAGVPAGLQGLPGVPTGQPGLQTPRPGAGRSRGRRGIPWLPTLSGCLDGGAQIFYLSALQHGLLISVAVLASLYPAVTVLMARVLLSERLRRTQQLGLAVAVVGVVLTAL